jgi:hypothetical protein
MTDIGNTLDSVSLELATIELLYSGSKVGGGFVFNKAGKTSQHNKIYGMELLNGYIYPLPLESRPVSE